MTNSMHAWSGGVVGVIRAELEIAKNLKTANHNIKFVKYTGFGFEELKEESLSWLWESNSVGDAYLDAMGRRQTTGTVQDQIAVVDERAALAEEFPGLANAYKYSTSRLYRGIYGLLLYANSFPRLLAWIVKKLIMFITWPLRALSQVRAKRRAKKEEKTAAQEATKHATVESRKFSYPFKDGDIVFSCGWMYSGKEEGFERVRREVPNLFITYLVYDLIIVRENTKQFYAVEHQNGFKYYLRWISLHCDAILCGGKTTVNDLKDYYKEAELPCPPCYPVYFGSDIVRNEKTNDKVWNEYRRKVGIERKFIIAVGSMDDRKNYSTLYRAITIILEKNRKDCPQLIIVGKGDASQDLLDTIKRDPLVGEKIKLLSPTDAELSMLYERSMFVVLASAWEGWSLTLPEAMQYCKLTIVSDVLPLREIGRDLVVYTDPFDPYEWAEKISFYCHNDKEILKYEEKLSRNFKATTWKDCGYQLANYLDEFSKIERGKSPVLYMDITLTWFTAMMGGNITGILRTELMLLRNMFRKYPHLKFFALTDRWGYTPIEISSVAPLITDGKLDVAFAECCDNLRRAHTEQMNKTSQIPEANVNNRIDKIKNKQDAYWFIVSIFPPHRQRDLIEYGKKKKKLMIGSSIEPVKKDVDEETYCVPFNKGDVIFTAGTGSGVETYEKLLSLKKKIGYIYCPIIYDLTPLLMPQVHQQTTVENYKPFIEFTSKMADLILYGGETARQDGITYQKRNKLPQPRSCSIKFGSDINRETKSNIEIDKIEKEADEKKILNQLRIRGPFVLAVGTMEIRKNHETLYRAYLRMLEEYDDIPQMVFAGHPGWKTGDFLATLSRDERVEGKIIQLTPTDEQLDILYRHCEFTVLASMYEGWSLTLPESFWYKKFCLCCDTPALKETAGELAEYIHRWDEKRWAERIEFYHMHPEEIAKRENCIARKWHTISWEECAEQVLEILKNEIENGKRARI